MKNFQVRKLALEGEHIDCIYVATRILQEIAKLNPKPGSSFSNNLRSTS